MIELQDIKNDGILHLPFDTFFCVHTIKGP